MRTQSMVPGAMGLIAVLAMITQGCGGDGNENAGATSGRTSSSSGGTGGAGGESGAGGQGGGVAVETGKSATETVSAGEVSKSPNYKMVFTFGQPTQNQDKTTSPGYQIRGGLVGANGGSK